MNLKIMTFNTQHCKNYITNKIDYNEIINLINKYNPDIIGLNEIYSFQLKKLAKELKYKYYFSKSMIIYGNGILSKYDINNANTIKIPNKFYKEKRAILSCNINIDNKVLNLYVTHLGLDNNKEFEIHTLISNTIKNNTIILGDFNIHSDSNFLKPLERYFVDTSNKNYHTYPSFDPKYKLDYIFASKDIKTISSNVLDDIVSDHKAIITKIKI